jgi:hypothetical protein
MRKTFAAASVIAAAALLAAATLAPSAEEAKAPAAAAAGEYQPVAPLEVVMEVVAGFYSKMPDKVKAGTPKDFKDLKREALFMAEMANLTSRLKGRSGEAVWKEAADLLKTQGLAMAQAAEKKDAAQFEGLHNKVKGTCKTCHDKYRDE